MQNFLLVADEILKSQIGSIKLTDKRVIQSRGKGKTFSVASIPVDKVSGSMVRSYIDNNWLALAGLAIVFAFVMFTKGFEDIYFLIPAFIAVYGIWKYYKSKRSILKIYSVGSAIIAEDVSSYNKSALINFTNALDSELIKQLEAPTGNNV